MGASPTRPLAAVGARPRGDGERSTRGGYRHLVPLLDEHSDPNTLPVRRTAVRQQLVLGYLPVAENIARRYRNRGIPLEDLVQVASVGLIHAVDRYEPDRGDSFLAYAIPYARGEVQRYFRDRGWAVRVPRRLKELHLALTTATAELSQRLGRAPRPSELAHHLGLPLEDVLDGLHAGQAYTSYSLDRPLDPSSASGRTVADVRGADDANLDLVEYWQALRPLIDALPPRERTILVLRFYGDHTQTQIARQIGVSQMHVSRLLTRTLSTLRTQLLAD
ncbi:MAG TPA: SigB/SigF/SigG family RNA polymerase sigma factor [Pseudonocardia sp.]